MNKLISTIVENEDIFKPVLFKGVQFEVLRKLSQNAPLSETEKRYLRGNIRNRLNALEIISNQNREDDLANFLNKIGSYYITGFEALKHNGFGWYYSTKRIEIINTKIHGTMRFHNKTIQFIRAKSISKCNLTVDDNTGLVYAANEQILKDSIFMKNDYLKEVWIQMFNRYRNIFVRDSRKYKKYLSQEEDVSLYGV